MQLSFFPSEAVFPTTRYQGSKRKIAEWIWGNISDLPFETVLDAFGGTGVMSHLFKRQGKTVAYNDYLKFNAIIGQALIENAAVTLSNTVIENLLKPPNTSPDFIQATFRNIYFTDAENQWLDGMIFNISTQLENRYEKALAYFALFQACIIKRPYNLFHRANLYMRQADVPRSFGNKITWDTPFEVYFRNFAREANDAVFDNGKTQTVFNQDALDLPTGFDLVYLDPPYFNQQGVGVDYRDFYHFLEGMVNYSDWAAQLDPTSKHRRLLPQKNAWTQAVTLMNAFEDMIQKHQQSILVISYREDGLPTREQITALLQKYKSVVQAVQLPKQYVLSKRQSHEILWIAQ